MDPRVAFVLASTDCGPMILNRLDYCGSDSGAVGIGTSLLHWGHHEQGDVDAMCQVLLARRRSHGDGVMAIDGGANVGTHTLAFARLMRDWGEVIAFEPQERVFYALAGNIALNNCFNARAKCKVLSKEDGAMLIPVLDHRRPANFGGLSLRPDIAQSPGQVVDFSESAMKGCVTTKIDSLFLDRCDLIKLDLEGMEPEALAGAVQTIEDHQPVLFIEIATCGRDAVVPYLSGYEIFPAGMSILAVHCDDPVREHLALPAAQEAA